MSVPILLGVCLACSWTSPNFPCGILPATALRASVAWVALTSLPWSKPHPCPWAQDHPFSPAQGRQSLPQQCRTPGSISTTALFRLAVGPPDPSLLADFLAGPWTCLITRNLPDDLGSGLTPLACPDPSLGAVAWVLAGGSLPCQLWHCMWVLASHPWGTSWPQCVLMLPPPWAMCCSASLQKSLSCS